MTISESRFYGGARYLAVTSGQRITFGLSRVWNLTASASGRSIKLDDARRVPLGWGQLTLQNTGSNAIEIQDNTGATLFSLDAGFVAELGLSRNSTQAGKWIARPVNAGSGTGTIERPTRDAITNPTTVALPEPSCGDLAPCGTVACFQHLGEYSAFRMCVGDTFGDYIEGEYPTTDVGAFMLGLYVGRGVAPAGVVSGPWMLTTFGFDPTVCAPGGAWGPDSNGLTWTWAFTGSSTSDVDSNPGIQVMIL